MSFIVLYGAVPALRGTAGEGGGGGGAATHTAVIKCSHHKWFICHI